MGYACVPRKILIPELLKFFLKPSRSFFQKFLADFLKNYWNCFRRIFGIPLFITQIFLKNFSNIF